MKGKSGDFFFENGKISVWTSVKVRECYKEVEQEDEDRQGTVQDILLKKHGLLEADHRASRRRGRDHFVVCMPSLPPISA